MMRGGISLTMPRPGVQERILLHLRDFYEFSESIEVPFSITETAGVNNIHSVTGDINGAGTHFLPDTSTGSASITVV